MSLRALVAEAFAAFTSVDGRLLRSLHLLVTRPGALTVAYMTGRRKPFVSPVSLFLITNVLFFAVESITGGNVFTTPLAAHLRTQPWSEWVQPWVASQLRERGTSLAEFAPLFDLQVALNARSLIIGMALCFGLVLMLVFRRSGRLVVVHAAFALHLYGFLLLAFCVATAIPPLNAQLGNRFDNDGLDHVLSMLLLATCAGYVFIGTTAVYGVRGLERAAKTLVMTGAAALLVLGYRFALFVVTLHGV